MQEQRQRGRVLFGGKEHALDTGKTTLYCNRTLWKIHVSHLYNIYSTHVWIINCAPVCVDATFKNATTCMATTFIICFTVYNFQVLLKCCTVSSLINQCIGAVIYYAYNLVTFLIVTLQWGEIHYNHWHCEDGILAFPDNPYPSLVTKSLRTWLA